MGEVSKPHKLLLSVEETRLVIESLELVGNVDGLATTARQLLEQVESLIGRNQFLSTEQVRADVCETAFRELSVNFESKVDELRSVEEQLDACADSAQSWKDRAKAAEVERDRVIEGYEEREAAYQVELEGRLDAETKHTGLLEQLETTQGVNELLGSHLAEANTKLYRLHEQYEALQAAARKFLATGNEIDLADLTTPGEYLYDLIPHRWPDDYEDNAPYPASSPKEDA